VESPFVGDSEMARRMREADWAGTPLGPPDGWPAPLRTAVGMMLRSQLPMYVAWGPQWQLLYNDAYAPLLAARHPDALGAPFATTWPEVWPGLRPAFEEVLAGTALFQEDLLMVLERRGYPEEAYFTFSVSAAGEPGSAYVGAFCACTETTQAVVGERRLRALGELGELAGAPDVETACAEAVEVLAGYRADVPAAMLYLLDDDPSVARLVAAEGVDPAGTLAPAVVELGSDAYWAPIIEKVAGTGRTAVVRGLADALPDGRLPGAGPPGTELVDAAPFDTAVVLPVQIGSAAGTAGLLVCAVSPHLPLDEEYRAFLELVRHHVATASTAAATFAAQRRRTEELAEAERRFRTMADSTPALIWADDPSGERMFVNRGWLEFTGAEPDADLGVAWRDRIHPADRAQYAKVRAGAGGGSFEVEYRLRAADGRYRWVLDRGAPAEGYAGGHVGGCLDIHTRVAERKRQQLLAVVGSALDRETTVAGRRATLVRTIVDEGLADLARFVEIDGSSGVHAIAAGTPQLEKALAALDVDWMHAREAVDAGRVRVFAVDDAFIEASTADEAQRELRRSIRFDTIVLVPLTARGHPSGLLAVARTQGSTPFDDDELALLTDLGERAGTALDNALLLEREQATRTRLELLQQATAALSAAATPQQVAVTAAEQLAALAQARAVTLWRLTADRDDPVLEALDLGEHVPAISGSRSRIALADAGAPAEAARSGSPVWADPEADPRSADCVPLIAAGTCVGVVGLLGHPLDVRTGAGRAALTVLAKLCAQALQRSGLLAAESAARRTAEELGEVVGALSGATTPVDVAEVVLDHAVRLGATSAAVLVRTADHLEVLASRAEHGGPWPDHRLSVAAPDPAARAARTGQPVWTDPGPAHAHVAVPLVLGGPGRPLGVIALRFDGAPRAFSTGERVAVLTLAGQCAQALDRARLHQAEHDFADVLQRSLLPSELPALPRLSVAARYLPSAVGVAAGGDWYDLLPIDEDRVALVVGDVVGHGASAAAVMGQLRSALAAYLLDGHNPAAALERLDRFARRVPGATGSTCVCLVLDCDTRRSCCSNRRDRATSTAATAPSSG
jgi:PAS domain S-box-containing protein